MPKANANTKKKFDIEVEISRCVNQLLLKEPFYSHILSGTIRSITNQIPTAAVGIREGHIQLMINETFFEKELTSISQRIAVLKHETLHLVFKHLFRELHNKDHELMNLAADIVVNQYIGEWELPESAVTLSTFPDLELEPGQTMEYYYDRLAALKGKKGKGKTKGKGGFPLSEQALEQLYGATRHSDHAAWTDEKSPLNPAGLRELLENQLLNAAARVPEKSYGTLPGEIREAIEMVRENRKPKVDWKRQLRLFASSHGKTYVSHTMRRISKRFGTRPGIRIKRKNRVVVVIDTSGSITNETLAVFMAEIEGIARTGAEVTIIEADCKVQDVYDYRRGKQIGMKGGGGTDFDPAFAYINSGKSGAFDACIYLTDGCASAPVIRPRTPVLWIVTQDGDNGEHLKWGRRVVLPTV
jgi:predicted metal-dependent peptidase